MFEPVITGVGNLTKDPELTTSAGGTIICRLNIACTPRVKNGDKWEDGETLWLSASLFGEKAEQAATAYKKGDKLVFTGRLSQRTYKGKDGSERLALNLDLDNLPGVSPRKGASPQAPNTSTPAADPWGEPAPF